MNTTDTDFTFENCEKIDQNDFAEAFAIDKSGAKYTLSRAFAIIPEHIANDKLDKYLQYSKVSKFFTKFNAYKNLYSQWLIKFYLDNQHNNLGYFESNSVQKAGYLYNEFKLSTFEAPSHYKSKNQKNNFKLNKRLKRSAYYSAYISVREWIKRREYLREVINFLINKFNCDTDFSIQFLSGKRFKYEEVKDVILGIDIDCYGEKSKITVNYLNNMIGQIRNIFFYNFDFANHDSCSLNFIETIIESLKSKNFQLSSEIANSFTKKENKENVFINENELYSYILDLFFRRVSNIATKQYKTKRFDALLKILGNIDINNFKTERNELFDQLKSDYSNGVAINDIYKQISDVWNWFLDDFFTDPNHYIIKKIFSPPHMRNFTHNIGFESFLEFFRYKIYYQIRKSFKFFFIKNDTSRQVFGYVSEKLHEIYNNIDNFLKIPVHKGFSMTINTAEIWSFRKKTNVNKFYFPKINFEDFLNFLNYDDISKGKLLFKISFIPDKPTYFQVFDRNQRLLHLIEQGFKFHNPTLTFKNRKILLNLPFQKEKGSESTRGLGDESFDVDDLFSDKNFIIDDIQIGVDLGLKHFAVLCVKKNGKIVKIYFLGAKQLFNMVFDQNTGNLVYQEKCFDKFGNFIPRKLTNIKLKLINLRKEIKNIQRLKNEYENRLINEEGITNFRDKLKWNKLRRSILALWQKVNNINSQIARYTGHFIYEIARYYHANLIKFEDLSWSTHSKKKDAGKFIARWQIHWLFSQMQKATADKCRALAIKVGVVDAKNSSKECSYCGKLGNRDGKVFSCKKCGVKLDSDLNASYNVVNRKIKSYI